MTIVSSSTSVSSVNVGNIDENCLFYIFSFLGSKDLVTAQKVCRLWRSLAVSEGLWKSLCSPMLPFEGSQRERYRLFHNWKNALAEVSVVPCSKMAIQAFIAKDGTFLELSRTDDANGLLARNLTTGQGIWCKNSVPAEFRNLPPGDVTGTTVTWLSKDGNLFCLNAATGEHLAMDAVPADVWSRKPQQCRATIRRNDRELHLFIQNPKTNFRGLLIWNAETGRLFPLIEFPADFFGVTTDTTTVLDLLCTPHFIVNTMHGNKLQVSRRKDLAAKSEISLSFEPCNLKVSGSLLTCINRTEHEIVVLKDTSERLTEMTKISTDPCLDCYFLHHNWLIVQYRTLINGRLSIYLEARSLSTGACLSKFEFKDEDRSPFLEDGNACMARSFFLNHSWEGRYLLYDFGGRHVIKLPIP
jgi:hypothetical protein